MGYITPLTPPCRTVLPERIFLGAKHLRDNLVCSPTTFMQMLRAIAGDRQSQPFSESWLWERMNRLEFGID